MHGNSQNQMDLTDRILIGSASKCYLRKTHVPPSNGHRFGGEKFCKHPLPALLGPKNICNIMHPKFSKTMVKIAHAIVISSYIPYKIIPFGQPLPWHLLIPAPQVIFGGVKRKLLSTHHCTTLAGIQPGICGKPKPQ